MNDDNTGGLPQGSLASDTSGSDFKLDSFELTPEEAEAVAGIEDFDALSVPSPVTWNAVAYDRVKVPEQLSADMLPKHLADPIRAEVAKAAPARQAEVETGLVYAALRRNGMELRVKAGAGPDATPYERELLDISRQVYDLEQEAYRLQIELTEVTGSRVVTDEATGEAKAQLIERVQGDRRKAYEQRLKEISYQVSLLNGTEGERRLAKAKKETAARIIARKAALAEDAEVSELAEKISRDQRIRHKAEARAGSSLNVNCT